MFAMKFLAVHPTKDDYLSWVPDMHLAPAPAHCVVQEQDLESHANNAGDIAITCVDRRSGRTGTFLHRGDFVAVSPVFADYYWLLVWLRNTAMAAGETDRVDADSDATLRADK